MVWSHRRAHTRTPRSIPVPSFTPLRAACLCRPVDLSNRTAQTSDAAFIPAGWDSKRLIDGLLSPDKTPWGPKATFAEVVAPPPDAVRRGASGSGMGGWMDGDSGGDGGGLAAGGGEAGGGGGGGGETVESEEAWLSSLGKQVAGADGKSRWPSAIAAASKHAKASKVKETVSGSGEGGALGGWKSWRILGGFCPPTHARTTPERSCPVYICGRIVSGRWSCDSTGGWKRL